jgi:hypothetical protein
MNKFCFIVPLTPKKNQSDFRIKLWSNVISALLSQKYDNWNVICVGESIVDTHNDKFIFLNFDELPKLKKVEKAVEYILREKLHFDYLIRLDDDDLISPTILNNLSDSEFDCYYDKYHTFVEFYSGRISQQKRSWIPNTAIHKFIHATNIVVDDTNSSFLLAQNHDKVWHNYYENKKVLISEKSNPLYLRVLTPTSVTSKAANSEDKFDDYKKYLLQFGCWSKNIKQFCDYKGIHQLVLDNVNVEKKDKIFNIVFFLTRMSKYIYRKLKKYKLKN